MAILCQVRTPGNYILATGSTLVRLISQVGGFTEFAATNTVKIIRTDDNSKKVSHLVDVGKVMSGEAEDFILMQGDLIFVDKVPEVKKKMEEEVKLVTLLGQISSPGNYTLTEDMTLVRLVAQAGGFTPTASLHNVRIIRKAAGREQTFYVDAGRILTGRSQDVKIEAGDLIVVQESFF